MTNDRQRSEKQEQADERRICEREANGQLQFLRTEATNQAGKHELQNLDVAGVCLLMKRLELTYCIEAIQKEEVDGQELVEYRSEEELITFLSKYGIYLLAVHCSFMYYVPCIIWSHSSNTYGIGYRCQHAKGKKSVGETY